MSDRRIQITDAPRDSVAYARIDAGWEALTTYLGDYLPLTGGTLSGQLIIDVAGEGLTFKAATTGSAANTWLQWDDSADARMGFLGYGSSGNEILYMWNDVGGQWFRDAAGTDDQGFLFSSDAAYTAVFENVAASSQDASIAIRGSRNAPSAGTQPASLHFEHYDSDDGLDYEVARIAIESQSVSTTHLDSSLMFMLRNASGTLVDVMELHNTDTYLKGDLYVDGMTGAHISNRTGTGSYGIVAQGESWNGWSANNQLVFMALNGEDRGGIYDDTKNAWVLHWNAANASSSEQLGLYTRDGTSSQVAARTMDYTLDGNNSSFEIRDHAGTYYQAGFVQMPRYRTNTSFTLTDSDAGGYFYHSNSTTYTITLNNSSGGGLDFPVGGTFFILNYGTGNVTVNTGSGTLYNPQLGTGTTGSRTVGGNSVATILKYAADSWFIWGDNIT